MILECSIDLISFSLLWFLLCSVISRKHVAGPGLFRKRKRTFPRASSPAFRGGATALSRPFQSKIDRGMQAGRRVSEGGNELVGVDQIASQQLADGGGGVFLSATSVL